MSAEYTRKRFRYNYAGGKGGYTQGYDFNNNRPIAIDISDFMNDTPKKGLPKQETICERCNFRMRLTETNKDLGLDTYWCFHCKVERVRDNTVIGLDCKGDLKHYKKVQRLYTLPV